MVLMQCMLRSLFSGGLQAGRPAVPLQLRLAVGCNSECHEHGGISILGVRL